MQFVLDHLSAILISSAVLLLVLSTQFSAQRAATEQSIAYAAKKQTLSMAEFLEQDFLLIGEGTPDGIASITQSESGNTSAFSFWREDDLGLPMLVSYTLTELDSVDIKGDMYQLYRLNRMENLASAGGGGSSLINFTITMLDETGSPTDTISEARLLRITAVNAYPYGSSDNMYLFRSFWGITVRPRNLG